LPRDVGLPEQEAWGQTGNVTGKGLARNIKDHYSPRTLRLLVLLLAAANLINIGADSGALGTGSAGLLFAVGLLLGLSSSRSVPMPANPGGPMNTAVPHMPSVDMLSPEAGLQDRYPAVLLSSRWCSSVVSLSISRVSSVLV